MAKSRIKTINPKDMADLIVRAKRLAHQYYRRTGRPLGVAGEVAEYEAARLLRLRLTPVRHPGYDAVQRRGGKERRLQIKCRVLLENAKPGQRLGKISLKHGWDAALLVILDERLDPVQILEAPRRAVRRALLAPGSKSRNERGQLPLSKFRRISRVVWPRV